MDVITKYIATSSVRKVATDGTVLSDTMITDVLLTEKAIVGAGKLAGQVGKNISLAGEGMYDLLPPELMDEVVTYAKTPAGELVAISEKTGINLGRAAAAKAITFHEQASDRTKTIIDKTASFPGQSAEEAAAFQKSMELRMNHVKVVDSARLDRISDIDQINRYRAHTKNFHPDGLAKLNPDEILHLNLCDWLEPKFREINGKPIERTF